MVQQSTEPKTTPIGNNMEVPRDTIVVTKTVEVVEYDNVTKVVVEPKLEEESNRTMMIIMVASIIGVLLVIVIVMVVRVFMQKRKMEALPSEKLGEVQTACIEVEPQFVLAADDTKNIFARPSTAPLNEAIEGSDNKKPGTAGSK